MDNYLDSGRKLFIDNFYTSIPLTEKLLQRKKNLIGTLRKDKIGNPKKIKKNCDVKKILLNKKIMA